MKKKLKKVDKRFQRKGSKSNAHAGASFEAKAKLYLEQLLGLPLESRVRIPIGFNQKNQKDHSFDLGNREAKILIECKSHRWTAGNKVPSAKLTVWNEAMLYFSLAPKGYRKIFLVLKHFNKKHKKTLAQHYRDRYYHLIPGDVEIIEIADS